MKHTIIIAEAGVNHNGSIELAKQLVDKAGVAGVDYIKFQTFKASKLVTKAAKQAEYQQKNIGKEGDNQYQMLKKLELSPEDHEVLITYCKEKGIKFFSTAFDFDSIEYLHSLNLGLWKVPLGEVTNYPFLKRVAGFNEKTILSTGMCDMLDVRAAVEALYKNGLSKENLILLHCNTEYPTPFKDVNLKAMDALRKEFGVEVGYSDHTKGIEVPIAAVALGATVIEKHFTLDRNMEGPDHKASLEPDELKAMVSAIRNMLLHKTKGSIVHISSISVHTGYKGLAMYASSKGALEAFSKDTAREWGQLGIRSNVVVPGFMATAMSASLTEEQRSKIYARTSLKAATDVHSVAETVAFLLSYKACSITGQNIHVDNGTI